MHPHILAHERLLPFVTAGKAIFTVRGAQKRFTFKVTQPKFEGSENLRFVKAMTGPDNENSYSYFAMLIRKQGRWTLRYAGPKAKLRVDDERVNAFSWFFSRVLNGPNIPNGLEIWHEGKCGCCGRTLTVPESIESGLGPICAGIRQLA